MAYLLIQELFTTEIAYRVHSYDAINGLGGMKKKMIVGYLR
jgi:hypothetical protein